MTLDVLLITIILGLFGGLVAYFYILMMRRRGGKTVENTSIIVLDYIQFMLADLRKRGYEYPHVVIFSDLSGRVCKGPAVGGMDKILFQFPYISGIATDYTEWQGKNEDD